MSIKRRILFGGALGILIVLGILLVRNDCLTSYIPPAEVQEGILMADGLKVFYQTAGNPQNQPLLFLHGWGARHKNVCGKGKERVTSELAKNFYVIASELPGLVRSEPPKEVWDMEDYANFIHSFLNTLNIQKPIVMGQSFGGGVATTYASLYPQNTPVLILVDATQGGRPHNWYYRLRFKWKPFFDWIVRGNYRPLWFKKLLISPFLGVPWGHISKENVRDYLVMTDIETTYKVQVDYKTLLMPTLLIWGEKDTRVTPLARAQEIHEEIPNSKLVIIQGGGHLALYTNTDEVAREILLYLKAVY